MSRLGKLPIQIPEGVKFELKSHAFSAKGPKGEVSESLPSVVELKQEGNQLLVNVKNPDNRKNRALWGLARQLVANAIHGVHAGFSRTLEVSGIGYKAQVENKDLVLNLGYSHQVRYSIPASLTVTVDKSSIIISGASKQLVGQTAAEIRSLKPPEPYKGKGIRYSDEVVRRKAGKVVKSAGAK